MPMLRESLHTSDTFAHLTTTDSTFSRGMHFLVFPERVLEASYYRLYL